MANWPVIWVRNPVTKQLARVDMQKLLHIDGDNLERECARQASMYGWVCAMSQTLENEVKRLTAALTAKEDAAFNAKNKQARSSVTALKKLVAADPEVVRARKKLLKATANHALLKAVLPAWLDRGKQLTNLTILQSRRKGETDE